ncbi:MAG TPA: quinone-dependent dihydroorotate dehydrogenase [Steroidobacteraceae bacterium]|nr:quinone-dependent dihydroorotate dehydrogenase [Steroidobacteraceae bacterium]
MIYQAARPALFLLPPEKAHALTLNAVRLLGTCAPRRPAAASTPVHAFGLEFPNRIGLAAGFDKNGMAVDGWFALGFGHVEVGTVTPRPQPGNPLPRVFRLPAANAVINRMGFPNDGAERIVARLRARKSAGVLGVNIGKNATTPLERAIDDYVACLRTVYPVADYITVNVSSPNTAGLRSLQDAGHLVPLLTGVLEEARALEKIHSRHVPLLVKLSPDMAEAELRKTAAAAASVPVAGIIATNTTLSREAVTGQPHAQEAGGLSGRPLFAKSTAAIRILRETLGPSMPLIGVGGVSSGADAQALRRAGADLVQIYTGLIYRGPGLACEIARALANL